MLAIFRGPRAPLSTILANRAEDDELMVHGTIARWDFAWTAKGWTIFAPWSETSDRLEYLGAGVYLRETECAHFLLGHVGENSPLFQDHECDIVLVEGPHGTFYGPSALDEYRSAQERFQSSVNDIFTALEVLRYVSAWRSLRGIEILRAMVDDPDHLPHASAVGVVRAQRDEALMRVYATLSVRLGSWRNGSRVRKEQFCSLVAHLRGW